MFFCFMKEFIVDSTWLDFYFYNSILVIWLRLSSSFCSFMS